MPNASARAQSSERLYHLIAVNDRTKRRECLTAHPDTHANCMTMKGRFSPHKDVRIMVEEHASVASPVRS